MSVKTDVVNLRVNVGNDKAQNRLNELRKTAADLKFEMDGLSKKTAEYAAKKKQLDEINQEMVELKRTIGLASLSQKELNRELKTLTAMRNSVVPFSDEYKRLDASIKQVKNRLYEVNNGVTGFSATFSKVKDEVKQFGMLAAGYLGFQFITSSFTNLIQGAGKLSDSLADLQRVTGLSREETRKFNEELKRLDTRTSTQQLREIAIVAGKLGVAKDDLLGFTQAVDMLVVALGDELGNADQITSTLGKILQVFDGRIDGDNITRLGNAIVQLANTGSATGAFVADFNQRLSGIAKSANIGLGALSGLGAGLEEMGGRVESSATAVQKIIISISSNLPAAAKIAGMELGAFNELFSKEPQEALLRYAAGLVRNKQSFAEITQSFAAAGEDGARVIETLSKLGQNTDFLRKRMQLGTEALQENSAITDAFNLKNETLGATIDKLAKEFNRLISSDGVQNFLKAAVEGAVSFVNASKAVVDWVNRNATALKLLVAAILIQNAARIKSIALSGLELLASISLGKQINVLRAGKLALAAVTALLSGNFAKATQAFQLLSLVVRANPFALLLTGISAALIALNIFSNKTAAVGQKIRDLNRENSITADVYAAAARAAADGIDSINRYTKVINSNVSSLDQKKKALRDLIALDPIFLKGLSLSNDGHLKGVEILDRYIQKLKQKAVEEALASKRKDLVAQLAEGELLLSRTTGGVGDAPEFGSARGDLEMRSNRNAFRTQMQQQEDLNKANNLILTAKAGLEEVDMLARKFGITLQQSMQGGASPIITPGGSEAEKKKQQTLIQQAREFYSSLAKLKTIADSKELSEEEQEIIRTKQRYAELLKQAVDFYQQKALTRQQFSEAEATISEALEKEIVAIRRKYNEKEFIASTEQEYRESLEARRNYSEELKRLVAFDYSQGKISKEQYQAAIVQIEQDEKADLITIALDYAGVVKQAAKDVSKFRIEQEEFVTQSNIRETERRIENAKRERAARRERSILTTRPGTRANRAARESALRDQFAENVEGLSEESEQYQLERAKLEESLRNLQEEGWKNMISRLGEYVNLGQQFILPLINTFYELQNQKDQAAFNRERRNNAEKAKLYKDQLDRKLISQAQYDAKVQAMQAEEDKKRREMERRQFERQKKMQIAQTIMNGAQAIISILAQYPKFDFGVAAAIAMGAATALTAAQVALISKQEPPELGRGALLRNGPKHNSPSRGMPVINPDTGQVEALVERGEAVISARAIDDPTVYEVKGTTRQITSALNGKAGGRTWAGGATVRPISSAPGWMTRTGPTIQRNMPAIMADGGRIPSTGQQPDQAEMLNAIDMLNMQMAGIRQDLNNWKGRIRAEVSIKEFREVEADYDQSIAASGL